MCALSRREFLKVAATAPLALQSLGLVQAAETHTRYPLIILFLSGGSSAKETFNPDPPSTPAELRGPLGTVRTRTGERFSELFPMLAERSDTFAVLRALDTGSTDHIKSAQTAVLHEGRTTSEHIGERAAHGGVPYLFLNPGSNWPAIQDAFRMSHALSPLWNAEERRFRPPDLQPAPGLRERRALLEAFERGAPPIASPVAERMQRFRETAFDLLLGGGRFAEAFSLPERDRERYGRTLTGDMTLLAKRFVESGAGAVTIYHEPESAAWDLHSNLEAGMKKLSPDVDRAASALIDDITRGRLQCLFLLMGEFNRTPSMNGNGGRDHWQYGNNAILAGGKIRPGITHGRTTPQGTIRDGGVQQQNVFGNTVLVAAGMDIDPVHPRVREVLQ